MLVPLYNIKTIEDAKLVLENWSTICALSKINPEKSLLIKDKNEVYYLYAVPREKKVNG